MKQDENYILKVDIRAAQAGAVGLWPIWANSENRDQWGNSADVQYLEEKNVTTDWATYTWSFKTLFPHDKLQFVFGKMGGFVDFDNLTLTATFLTGSSRLRNTEKRSLFKDFKALSMATRLLTIDLS